MKMKYLIIVSLILAILTIGAASASYDADTLAVDDGAGDEISQADDMDIAGQDGESGENPEDERSEVDYAIVNEDGDYILMDDDASIDIRVNDQDITGNITVKLVGEDETEKVISQEIVSYTPAVWDEYGDIIEGPTGGNSILLKGLNLNPGKYNVAVSYDGDENYRPFAESFEFNYCFLYDAIDDEVYNDITLRYIDGLTGSIEMFVDNVSYFNSSIKEMDWDSEGGYGYIPVYDLSFGHHTYKITYTGDDYALVEPLEGEFNRTFRFSASINDGDDVKFGDNATVEIYYPSNANGEIIITYNGKTITKKIGEDDDDEGETYVSLSDLNLGENNITITLKSDNYPEKSINKTVNVYAQIVCPYPVRYNNDEDVIFLVLPSDAKGNLVIYVANGTDDDWNIIWKVFSNITLVDGKANASVSSLGLGDHTLKVEYVGEDYDSYFDDEDNLFYINVIPNVIYESSVYVKGNNSIKIVLPDDVNDTLTVSLIKIISYDEDFDEYEYGEPVTIYSKVANGTVTIQLPELEVGEYVFDVEYGEDNNRQYDLDVRENAPEFDLNITFPSVIGYNRWVEFIGLPEDIDGQFDIYVDGNLYESDILYDEDDDKYYFDFDEYGTHTWEIRFSHDSYYKETSKNGTFFIDWIYVPENLDNGDEITVSLDNKTGYVQLVIDGKNYATEMLDDGWINFEIEGLSIGNHTYEITYFDENNVKQLSKSGSFKTDYEFSTDIEYGEYAFTKEFEVEIYLPTDATGVITVSVAGKNYTATPVNGTATVILENLVMGENNVTITYAGDSKYPDKELKEVINMTGYEIIVKYDDPEGEDGFVYVSISLPENANGNLTIYNAYNVEVEGEWVIDGEAIWSVKLEKGFAKLTLANFTSEFGFGGYNLIASYVSASEEPDYEVEDVDFHFDIVPDVNLTKEIVMGENATVTIIIPNATGVIKVYEDLSDEEDEEQKLEPLINITTSDNGTFKGVISGLKLGEHILVFEYVGDDMENMFNMHVGYSVDVTPKKAEIPEEFNADGSGEIAFEVPEGANGTISVYEVTYDKEGNEILKPLIENATYTSENKSVAVSGLKTGDHNIKVVYKDDKNGEFEKETEITVPKPDAGASFTIPDTISGDTLDITLPKDATGNVLVTVDGKTSMMPLVNGSAKVDLSNLSDGAHTITVKYYGDGNFSGFEKSANMTIKRPVDPKITASNLNILYTASTKYTVTIYGTDGNVAANTQVTFLINGKVYKNVKTNAKGIASVAITQKPGTYKITTKALGKEVTKTLKVKHIVKLQKVKVKRSAKKLVIKVTLSKVNGKYIKKQKVTLKFKGKKYTAKTNSKGVAKFTIKKNVLKKLKKGKKVTYTATYKKDTVKKTVKVQK